MAESRLLSSSEVVREQFAFVRKGLGEHAANGAVLRRGSRVSTTRWSTRAARRTSKMRCGAWCGAYRLAGPCWRSVPHRARADLVESPGATETPESATKWRVEGLHLHALARQHIAAASVNFVVMLFRPGSILSTLHPHESLLSKLIARSPHHEQVCSGRDAHPSPLHLRAGPVGR